MHCFFSGSNKLHTDRALCQRLCCTESFKYCTSFALCTLFSVEEFHALLSAADRDIASHLANHQVAHVDRVARHVDLDDAYHACMKNIQQANYRDAASEARGAEGGAGENQRLRQRGETSAWAKLNWSEPCSR